MSVCDETTTALLHTTQGSRIIFFMWVWVTQFYDYDNVTQFATKQLIQWTGVLGPVGSRRHKCDFVVWVSCWFLSTISPSAQHFHTDCLWLQRGLPGSFTAMTRLWEVAAEQQGYYWKPTPSQQPCLITLPSWCEISWATFLIPTRNLTPLHEQTSQNKPCRLTNVNLMKCGAKTEVLRIHSEYSALTPDDAFSHRPFF